MNAKTDEKETIEEPRAPGCSKARRPDVERTWQAII